MPFRSIVGHRRLIALLSRAVARTTLPPSLLLAGPAGVGKRRAALAIAETINCTNPPTPADLERDACGECASCRRIARGSHPDVIVLQPGDSGTIKIEDVRDVVQKAGYRPFEARRRVVIIDEADALVPAAQNALLKTLEEPPSSSVFILVSSRPDSLLPTVLSRCPRLRFHELSPEDVAAALIRNGKKDVEAHAIAALANGSVGAALDVTAETVVDARDVALRVLTKFGSTDDVGRRVEAAKELLPPTTGGAAADREYLSIHLRAIASLLRDVELVSANGDRRTLANPDVEGSLGRLAVFRGDRGIHAFDAIDEALDAIDGNVNVKIVADWVATQI